ncbi:unnamed protein product [Gongylonema pulchrum]|uniref:Transmembrane protein n=1 Tax=Gongylonema pulchrum TaxID=637853 RepID=A0A183E2B8_9BILA|nr:unnamed protein product [Gongylonema pulchrum]
MELIKTGIALFLLSFWLLVLAEEQEEQICDTRELTQQFIKVPAKVSSWTSSTPLDLYHCNGFDYSVAHIFMDVYLQINLTNEDTYQLYQGENCSQMLQHYRDDQRLWGLVRRVKLLRSKQLSPFQSTVVGIRTQRPYAVKLRVWIKAQFLPLISEINYMRLAVFLGGLALFVMSQTLVRNAFFYYTSGCMIGVLASLLIVGFVVYRFTPKVRAFVIL